MGVTRSNWVKTVTDSVSYLGSIRIAFVLSIQIEIWPAQKLEIPIATSMNMRFRIFAISSFVQPWATLNWQFCRTISFNYLTNACQPTFWTFFGFRRKRWFRRQKKDTGCGTPPNQALKISLLAANNWLTSVSMRFRVRWGIFNKDPDINERVLAPESNKKFLSFRIVFLICEPVQCEFQRRMFRRLSSGTSAPKIPEDITR